MLGIVKVVALFVLQVTQFTDEVKMGLISRLISGISGTLQKFLIYSNGTAIH